MRRGLHGWPVALIIAALLSVSAWAQLAPRRTTPTAAKVYRHPDLYIPNILEPVGRLPVQVAGPSRKQLAELQIPETGAFFDRRAGRWSTLMPAAELLQRATGGNGSGWEARNWTSAPAFTSLKETAWATLEQYLREHAEQLDLDLSELTPATVTVHDGGDRIQIYAGRQIDGLLVRDAYLTAVLSHGRLILLGLRHWGEVEVSTEPRISSHAALAVVSEYLGNVKIEGRDRRASLILVPLAEGRDPRREPVGQGYRHRLAWRTRLEVGGEPGQWEALVDAHSGDLLLFDDTRHYATPRKVVGGVYPVSNDGEAPDGVEQAGYPMPYADLTRAGELFVTDSAGNHPVCVEGEITTALDGPFIRIEDFCGPISEASHEDIDLGTSAGIDCVVPEPGASSPGNTHAARTAFYELNRISEQARGHLPGNLWLQDQLTAVVNIPDFGVPEFNCNAFWDESTVNFFTSGAAAPGLACSNTGEIAGVLDHEWGHGLDDNDAVPTISNPGEGISDVYAALRLNESCVARGFFVADNPCGDDDPCLGCNGVREIDWAKRESGLPHDIAWIDTHCEPPFLGELGPCGGAIHCEGAVYAEAIWDLVHRDLQSPPFNMDLNTALEVGTRLTYLGAGAVGAWYSCVDGAGTGDGCNADSGYLNFLAVDDDNGDLSDGTPHMEAIFNAFDRHGIACSAPSVVNSGCVGEPTVAPIVTISHLDRGAVLSWAPVAGAAKYQIFRTEGVSGCNFGKVKVGETTGAEFVDGGLLNGFEFHYLVIPVGEDDACMGPASTCMAVTPTPGPNLSFDESSVLVEILNGDLDSVIDNCEEALVLFDLVNVGTGSLGNVEIIGVEVLSHPGSVIVTTQFPVAVAPTLADCERAEGSFTFRAEGLSFNDTLVFRIDLTSDELGGRVKSHLIELFRAETSLERFASRTFTFESDLEDWQVLQGTFERSSAIGGAQGSAFSVASSENLPDQCDVVRSPLLQLSPSSTLSIWTHYDIEPPLDLEGFIFWFDRANVGLWDVASGKRTPVSPDSGRTYNASGLYGSCGTENQEGWADAATDWAESTWSSSALGASQRAEEFVQLDIRYGTDPDLQGSGFRFDQVTLSDLDLVGSDTQTDVCVVDNSPPVAQVDFATAVKPEPVVVPVLSNDTDPDAGDTLRVLAVSQPISGQALINEVGPGLDTVTYVPGEGPGGLDNFQYSITDGRGGSAIATITIDRAFIFYSGFEAGDLSAWGVTDQDCDPNGIFGLTGSSAIRYTCCLGLVDIDIEQFSFSDDGARISSAPSDPVELVGAPTSCPVGEFFNTGSIPGDCRETYTLDGAFTGPDTWSGTYSMTFSGPDCSCLDIDPCIDQIFDVTATR